MKPLILVSNDDSIYAKGIKVMVEIAKKFGDVVVVAPDKPQSAKSHSVTLDAPLTYKAVNIFGDEIEAYKCSGTPADCVKMAIHQILDRKPDLVLSGINHGANYSINLLYSGTMAAAIEGHIHGIPAIALSILSYEEDADFSLAEKHGSEIVKKVINNGLSQDICLNVNIPYINENETAGIKVCRQTKGIWAEEFVERKHPKHDEPYYWLTGKYTNLEPNNPETDIWAIDNNYIAIVPLQIDFTNYPMLEDLKKIF